MSNILHVYCLAVDCGALPNPENGIVDTSAGTTLGHNATYRCNTGYRRRGSMFRTCSADGLWTPSKPSCYRKHYRRNHQKTRIIIMYIVASEEHCHG